MRPLIRNLFVSFFSAVVFLLLIEGITRLIYHRTYTNAYDFRLSRPAPYMQSEYFSAEFVKESFHQPGKWINPPGTRLVLPGNYKGKYFNVTNHIRVTTNTPAKYHHQVYLFGGSTVYCSEVPDTHTVTSYLQRFLNSVFPDRYKVVNLGSTSINTLQQLERLQTLKPDSGDIVCFYGGVNDGLLFTTGRINGWIMGENYIEYSTKLNPLQKITFNLYSSLHSYSRFVEIFLNPFSYQTPAHLKDTSIIRQLKLKLKYSYINNIIKADSLCCRQKVFFINFLQPHLFTRKNPTTYEKKLMQNKYLIPDPWKAALLHSYPVLKEANAELRARNIITYDLCTILDSPQTDYYLDFCHVTEKANKKIAEEISKKIILTLERYSTKTARQ